MPIETVNGQDFYNYQIKDARIVDRENEDTGSIAPSAAARNYNTATLLRMRKKRGKCKRFRTFLYNKENKTSCNRKGKHWGALIFYFAFFLGLLFILFFCYFYGINRTMTMSKESPEKLLPAEKKFYISEVPTFTFVPINVNSYPQPLVWYKMSGADSPTNRRAAPYANAIRQFYKAQATICTKQKVETCAADPANYGPCGQHPYGYDEQKPCFLLKLNTRSGWRPDAYHSMHKVPSTMPKELKSVLDVNRETLCIHCAGTLAHDVDKIGKVTYYPEPCYNDSSFPFSDGPVSPSPTIAIQLTNAKPGFVVELTCRLFGLDADGTGEHSQSIFIYVGEKK